MVINIRLDGSNVLVRGCGMERLGCWSVILTGMCDPIPTAYTHASA